MGTDAPRILIVDDEPDTCENLSDILTDVGYRVDIAHDGFAALKLVQENAYDIALLDLRMPGMDGLELYRQIRKVSAGTVGIVITAYASSDMARSVLSAGAWRIVPKPVNVGGLLEMVTAVIDTPLVLVVDDDQDLCDNLWGVFRERGYRVWLAHDLPDAERTLRHKEFDVVLIDMKLPTGEGSEVLRKLQQANKEARAILVAGCAAEMEAKVEKALEAGADAVCYKPFDVDKLLGMVQSLCAQRSQSS
jgi:DNA-binding response OmpR family regulator